MFRCSSSVLSPEPASDIIRLKAWERQSWWFKYVLQLLQHQSCEHQCRHCIRNLKEFYFCFICCDLINGKRCSLRRGKKNIKTFLKFNTIYPKNIKLLWSFLTARLVMSSSVFLKQGSGALFKKQLKQILRFLRNLKC